MKIIFLDIDGVLNHHSLTCKSLASIMPRCVRAFNRIIDATDAKIVLSSSWRSWIHNGYMTATGFACLLHSHGVRGDVIGCTRPCEADEPRYKQIRDWTRNHGVQGDRYCVIDDDPEAFGGRLGVQTKMTGLTERDADLAIEILNA